MKKLVSEQLGDILRPKKYSDVLEQIKDLSVANKLEELEKMKSKWGKMYNDLINDPDIVQNIREEVKKELDKLEVVPKVNYIENIQRKLPDIFSGMKDEDLLNELKEYILSQPLEEKTRLVWRFFKSWPDLFKDVEDDPRIDPETNQILLLFKIKGAIDRGDTEEIQEFIHELGEKYGRKTILDRAAELRIPEGRYEDHHLFNRSDIEQIKLSLYKETRSEEELERDEYYDVYAFIGYPEFIEKEIDGETYHKKRIGIENLVKIDKYSKKSLSQIPMMKIRAKAQYGGDGDVWGVYIPKDMWDRDYAYNQDIDDSLRRYIDENKFKI